MFSFFQRQLFHPSDHLEIQSDRDSNPNTINYLIKEVDVYLLRFAAEILETRT